MRDRKKSWAPLSLVSLLLAFSDFSSFLHILCMADRDGERLFVGFRG